MELKQEPEKAAQAALVAEFPAEIGEDKHIEQEAVFTWQLDCWDELPPTVESPQYSFGDQNWVLTLHPQGAEGQRNAIALFLKRPDAAELADICVQFVLILHNPQDHKARVAHRVNKRFARTTTDWGYRNFTDLRQALMTSDEGPPLISNNRTCVTLILRKIADPTGLLWMEDFSQYDSRKHTGYIGLENQGATCYLNSLVQSLYFTTVFREIVYAIPPADRVTESLQTLFCLLKQSPHPVSTLALTQSFGWDGADAFTQHDVQELNRVLMDKLESSMKGSKVEGSLNDIFVGQMRSYIKCVNVDFESSRTEDFWDVQLNVKGMKDVYASFDNYVEVEMLNGENQYAAPEFGLQDAQKGVIFEKLPPVLHLQLKRYDYDFMNDIEVKINDRYEFPLELDLHKYVNDAKQGSYIYELYGVLVHSGDLNAGHYYTFVRPTTKNEWFRFDDDRVTPARLQEVLQENYGGSTYSSAYMLVYIDRSKTDFVLPKKANDPPANIQDLVKAQQLEEEKQRIQQVERRQNFVVHLLTSRVASGYSGLGVIGCETTAAQLKRDSRLSEQLPQIQQALGIQGPVTLWLASCSDGSSVQLHLISERFLENLSEQLLSWSNSAVPMLWVEEKPGDPETQHLVFVKEFDGEKLTLLGSRWVSNSLEKLSEYPTFIESRGYLYPFASKPRLNTAGCVFLIDKSDSPDKRTKYYHELNAQVTVNFYKANEDEEEPRPLVVTASLKDSYAALAEKAGAVIGVDPKLLKLVPYSFVRHYQKWIPKTTLKSDGSNIRELWSGGEDHTYHVIYDVLDRPLTDQERLSEMQIYWYPDNIIGDNDPITVTADLETPLIKVVGEFLDSIGYKKPVVVWQSMDLKGVELVSDTGVEICALPSNDIYITPQASQSGQCLTVFHYSRDTGRTHGTPYHLWADLSKGYDHLLAELQRSSGLHGKTFEKVRLYYERDGQAHELNPQSSLQEGDLISLVHSPRRKNLHSQQIIIK